MVQRKKPKAVQCNIRMAGELRDNLKKAAKRNGRSFNAETAGRLGKSFLEEQEFGGPEGLQVKNLMISAFIFAGHSAAGGRKISQWISDTDCYTAAWLGVAEALMAGVPVDRRMLLVESLKGRTATKILQKGKAL